jgi:GNAT superfamily N-acetyltransferase
MDEGVTIREAGCADAGAIARVHVESWRTTYRGLMPDAVLDGLSVEQRRDTWERLLCPARAGRCTFVAAAVDGEVIGFADGGPPQVDVPGYDGELYAIYLLRECQGHGVGRRLVQAVADWLTGRGYRRMVLWVLSENHPSRRFYERLGGMAVARQPFEIGGAWLDEIAYGYDLPVLTAR